MPRAGDFLDEWQGVADIMTTVAGHAAADPGPVHHLLPGPGCGPGDPRPPARRRLRLPLPRPALRLRRGPPDPGPGGAPPLPCRPPDRLPFVIRRSLPNVALTLAVSFDTALRWRGTALPADSVVVVHTGIDMESYLPSSGPGPAGHPTGGGRRSRRLHGPLRRAHQPREGPRRADGGGPATDARLPHAHLVLAGGPRSAPIRRRAPATWPSSRPGPARARPGGSAGSATSFP